MNYLGRITVPSLIFIINSFNLIYYNSFTVSTFIFLGLNVLIGYIIGIIFDRLRLSFKQLKTNKNKLEHYKQALQSSIDGIGITDNDGNFEFMNKSQYTMYGYQQNELKSWEDCYSQDTLNWLETEVMPIFHKTGYWQGEVEGLRKDGATFPQDLSISKIAGTNKVIAVVRDTTTIKKHEHLVSHMAWHNDLTDIPNRRSLLRHLNEKSDNGTPFSLLFIDLDSFKTINDTLGHSTGDQLLVLVGKRLQGLENDKLSVYHLGGDEFILVITKTNLDDVRELATNISEHIMEPFQINENELFLTPSIGISRYPDDSQNLEQLLIYADFAMYHAKQQTGTYFQFYTNEIKSKYERKVLIEKELKKAIVNEEFHLNFQPKYCLTTNRIMGMEALLRWNSPVLGSVSPGEFIPIAEDSILINDLGKWVLHESITYLDIWKKEGYLPIKMSVNISNKQLQDNAFIPYLRSVIKTFEVDPRYLELEITESMTTDPDIAIPLLNSIKKLGVGLSIDDFGTGYSSLSILNFLPIDTLKIDRSFINQMDTGKYGLDIIKTIIDIGNNMNLSIVAEGIETETHCEELKKLNCPIGQGYYFSKPVSAEVMEELLLR